MAAGAMASFISRVSSFLLAAATLSATNQPLNNQHHQQHHQLQQQHHHHHHQPHHTQPHDHQQHHPMKFQHHRQPPKHHRHHHQLLPPAAAAAVSFALSQPAPPQQHRQQHLTNRATVSFGADLASSSTSRASNIIPAGAFTTFIGSPSPSSPPPASSSSASAPSTLAAAAMTNSPPPSAPPSSSTSSSPSSAAASLASQGLAYSSAPLGVGGGASTMMDVFEYVMHYKPNTPLISPSSLTFSTIPIDFGGTSSGNSKQHQRHHQHQHQQPTASLLPAVVSEPLSSAASSLHQQQPQQVQQHRPHQQQQQPYSQQLQAPLQHHQPPHLHLHLHQQPQPQPQPQQQQQQQQVQRQTAPAAALVSNHSASSSSLLDGISRSSSSNSSIGRGILSRFSLLQQQNNKQQRREDVCGRTMQTPQRRIIGGEGARYGEFPYQVHIKIAKHQCGGALIDKQSIVTAAHCVYHFMTRAPVSKLQIVIGAYDIEDEQYQELPPQYFKVNKVKLHPQFRFSASHPDRYDIAILKLDKPVKYTDNVLPVCLPSRDLKFESMIGTVTGFGKTDPSLSNRYGTRLLQKVDVPIIENNECERWHRTRGIDLKIFPEMMCAGYEDGLKDACVGDSGGPLVVKTGAGPNGSFRWTLAGITSAGFGCAQSRQPGIYHRVSHTVDWILENLD